MLDEATANVDLQTDNFIQEKLKESFKNCTVIIIAHRLATVIDSDRILVMADGMGQEFDHPEKGKEPAVPVASATPQCTWHGRHACDGNVVASLARPSTRHPKTIKFTYEKYSVNNGVNVKTKGRYQVSG